MMLDQDNARNETGLSGQRSFWWWRLIAVSIALQSGSLCLSEFRSEAREPLDFSGAGMEINFCPWCGTNLKRQYGQLCSGHDNQTPKGDFEERFPNETGMLFDCSCAVPVC